MYYIFTYSYGDHHKPVKMDLGAADDIALENLGINGERLSIYLHMAP